MLNLDKIISIKNLRKEQPVYEYQVRVDRASVLGNPYVMHSENERDQVCDQYEDYFKEQIKDKNSAFMQELRRLYKILKKYNKLELYCWCAPKRCHAETIKNFLLGYFSKEKTPISTSTELKIGCLKNKGEDKMKVDLSKLELGTSKKNSMLPVSELNRKDYLDNPEILNKYFRVNNHDIDTCYVSEEISIDEVRADFHNKKLYKDGNMLKSKTAEYYTGNKFYLNLDADDDSFRNGDDDSRKLSGYDVYVAQEVRSSTIDKDLFEELYRFCIKTIKRRLVMLLDTEKIINELINIINYTDGFSNNCTAIQSSALVNSKKNLLKKISDKSVKEFIKSNNDYTVFGTDELTRNDYIETYQRVLRKLTDIRDCNLDFIRDIISNKEDSLENEILENNLELETISLSNSENSLELNY